MLKNTSDSIFKTVYVLYVDGDCVNKDLAK